MKSDKRWGGGQEQGTRGVASVTWQEAFLEATSLDVPSPPLSSPDAIFTGSAECLSGTRVVIEREMNVGRVQRAGKLQCNAIRGRKRPVSFRLTGLELRSAWGAGEQFRGGVTAAPSYWHCRWEVADGKRAWPPT